jgi:hypothetical protein
MSNTKFYIGIAIAAAVFGLLLSFFLGTFFLGVSSVSSPVDKTELKPAQAPTVITPAPTITIVQDQPNLSYIRLSDIMLQPFNYIFQMMPLMLILLIIPTLMLILLIIPMVLRSLRG